MSKTMRTILNCGGAIGALTMVAGPLMAESASDGGAEAPVASVASAAPAVPSVAIAAPAATIREQQSYVLKLMMQLFNGTDDYSETRYMGVGRFREGNRSYTQFDYGDGSIVLTGADGELSATSFENVTAGEKAVIYDYDTQTMHGDGELAGFHNQFVRPLLNRAPPLGSDASWQQKVPLSATGVAGITGSDLTVELSREYFSHDGKPMVLIHYKVPAFSYDAGSGSNVVQWAEGISLTDPGFGMIYINSALHRGVEQNGGDAAVPYRMSRTMVAANKDGSAMVDYRTVPQLARYIDRLFSKDAIMVVPNGGTPGADQKAVDVMRGLDIVALSLGENSANEGPGAAGAQTGKNTGTDRTSSNEVLSDVGLGNAVAGNIYTWGDIVAGSPEEQKVFAVIKDNIAGWQVQGKKLGNQLEQATSRMHQLDSAGATEMTAVFNPKYANLEAQMTKDAAALEKVEDAYRTFLNTVTPGSGAGQMPYDDFLLKMDELGAAAKSAREAADSSYTAYKAALDATDTFVYVPKNPNAYNAYLKASEEVAALNKAVVAHGKQGATIVGQVKSVPNGRFGAFKAVLGPGLTILGNAMNGYTIGASLANLNQDTRSGDLNLTRTYGSSLAFDENSGYTLAGLVDLNLGLDLLGLAGAVVSGDVVTASTTAMAIGTSSVTDIYLSAKGYKESLEQERKARIDELRTETEQQRRRVDEFKSRIGALDKEAARIDKEIEELDKYDQKAKDALEQRRKERQEWRKEQQRQKKEELERQRREAEQKEAERKAQEEENERRRTANDRLKEDIKPDYPTRDPASVPKNKKKPTVAKGRELTQAEKAAAEREKRRAKAQKELNEYQEKILAEKKADEENRDPFEKSKPKRYQTNEGTSRLVISDLIVSELNMEPVTAKPVVFTPPEWKPPKFDEDEDLFVTDEDGNTHLIQVGPDDFKYPDHSEFPPTDPDDLDGYPGTGEYPSATWDSMSGSPPDLSKWEDWLATQDRRKLEQLAIAAGYGGDGIPGWVALAFALQDAENIIRRSQDSGYRAYANRGPNCAGTTGCTGSLGPWRLAYATIRLGDILAQSRDIFSTGGFSDIGISGFNLMYILRDFGVEDGDLIDVEITQFGRPIYTQRGHFLTNAGSPFNVNLQPGVAQLVITALNEGSASPNTAEITIENVVRGEARQEYNLNTGQTAVLRIEANATPEPSSSTSSRRSAAQPATSQGPAAARQRRNAPDIMVAPPKANGEIR